MTKQGYSMYILKKVVVDGLLILALCLILISTSTLMRPYQRGFNCGDESLMYPYHGDTVTVPVLRTVTLLLPLLAILFCELSLLYRSSDTRRCLGVPLPRWVRGVYCSLVSFFLGYCFVEVSTNVGKNIIGRLRPHFFDMCKPSIDCTHPEWMGKYVLPSEYECLGIGQDEGLLEDMRKSFPSGHSAIAAYAMVFFVLYLHQRMTWRATRLLRHTLQFGALMLSWITALSRVSDYKHHWSDVLIGYLLGAVIAVAIWHCCTDVVQNQKSKCEKELTEGNHMTSPA